jgi:two-component system, OmpR family, phosphate regulon sensor histidine kinase PhoR
MSGDALSQNNQQEIILSELVAGRNDSLNQLTEGILVIGDDRRCLYANEAALRLCQSSPEALFSEPIFDNFIFNPEGEIYHEIVNCHEKGYSLRLEKQFESAEGATSLLEIRISPLKNAVLVVLRDITETEHAKSQLAVSKNIETEVEKPSAEQELIRVNRILLAIRRINQIISQTKDPGRLLTSACETLSQIQGFERCWAVQFDADARVIAAGHSGIDKYFDDFEEQMKKGRFPDCLRSAVNKMATIRHVEGDESCRECPRFRGYNPHLHILATPLKHLDRLQGGLVAIIGDDIIHTVEEEKLFEEVAADLGLALNNLDVEKRRRQAEQELAESEERFRLIMQSAKDIITRIVFFPKLDMEFVSPSVQDILGYTPEEFRYEFTHGARFIHPEDRPRMAGYLKLDQRLVDPVQVYRVLHKDGRTIWIEHKNNFLADEKGNIIAAIGVGRDITEKKKAHDEMVRVNHVLLAVRNINEAIVHIKDPEKLLKAVCLNLTEIRGYNRVWAAQVDANQNVSLLTHEGIRDSKLLQEHVRMGRYTNCLKAALASGKLVLSHKGHPVCQGCLREHNQEDPVILAVPMIYNGRLQGFFVTGVSNDVEVNEEETNLLQELAEGIAFTLHSLQLEKIRQAAEKKLAASEELYRIITQNARDLITRIKVKPELEMEYVSPSSLDLLGYSPEEMKYDFTHGRQFIHPEDRARLGTVLETISEANEMVMTNRWLHKDGRVVWIEHRNTPIMDADNNVIAVVGAGRDITERIKAEETLADEALRRRILVEQSIDGIVVLDRDGKVYEANRKFAEMIGYSPEEVSRLTVFDWEDQIPPEILSEMMHSENTAGSHLQTRHRRKDGSTYEVEISNNTVTIAGQKLTFCVCRDITERIQAEKALKESEEKYSRVVEQSNDGIIVINSKGSIVFVNTKTCEFTGYNRAEILNQPFLKFVVPEAKPALIERFRKSMGGEVSAATVEFTLLKKNQTVMVVEANESYLIYQGQPAILAVLRDISERKKADAQIRLNEARLESLLKISQYEDPDLQNLLDYAVEETVRLTGSRLGYFAYYSKDKNELAVVSWSGQVPTLCKIGGDSDHCRMDTKGLAGEVVRQKKAVIFNHYQIPNALKKGLPPGHVELSNYMSVPLMRGEEIKAVVGVANKPSDYDQADLLQLTLLMDATWKMVERRRSEEERQWSADEMADLYQKEKQQRLELQEEAKARGLFIDVLAHELRTPLTPILASTSMMKDVLESGPDNIQKKLATNILASAQTLAHRLEELLDVARYSRGTFKLNLQPVDLNKFVDDVLVRFKPTTDQRKQKLVFELHGNLPVVEIDPSRLEQVLINLLSNASKFSEVDGEIFVRTEEDNEGVLFEVRDNGIGISADEQARLFQPYHRVEQDRQRFPGIGLGLAVARQIVEAHNGKIWLTSETGKGSTFSFRIPVKKARPITQNS